MEMPGSGSDPGLRVPDARSFDEVLDEHAELREAGAQIAGAADLATLGERLDRLLSLLETHYAREEAPDGVLAWIGARSEAQAALLQSEHGDILSTLRDLVRRVRSAEPAPSASSSPRWPAY